MLWVFRIGGALMNGRRHFGKQAAAALFGNALYLVSQFGILAVLARMTNPEIVGLFGLALAIATPIVMFTNLGLQIALATDASNNFRFGEYAALRAIGTGVALFILAAVGILFFSDPPALTIFAALAAAKIVETYTDLCYGQFQKMERIDLMARSQIMRGPMTFLLFTFLLWSTGRAEMAFFAQLIIWLTVALLHDRRIVNRSLPSEDTRLTTVTRARLWELTRIVWPLGINAVAAALSNNAPRLIVQTVLGLATLGYFTAISYVLYAGMFFANALGAVIAPRLSRSWSDGDWRGFHRLTMQAVAIAGAIGAMGTLVAWLAGGFILTFAFGPEYAAFQTEFTVILAALGLRFVAVALQTALSAQRRFASMGWMQTTGLVVTVGSTWLGAINMGFAGAAAALALTAAVQIIIVSFILLASRRGL